MVLKIMLDHGELIIFNTSTVYSLNWWINVSAFFKRGGLPNVCAWEGIEYVCAKPSFNWSVSCKVLYIWMCVFILNKSNIVFMKTEIWKCPEEIGPFTHFDALLRCIWTSLNPPFFSKPDMLPTFKLESIGGHVYRDYWL